MVDILSTIFIAPSILPGGRDWHESCAVYDTLLSSATGRETAHIVGLQQRLGCSSAPLGGLIQVLFLLSAYGTVLFIASNLIADGSELLLLVPNLRGLIGSVVLPILGAVPDGALVLFSALGKNAQEEVAVGVGALAGSTIILLTVPWFFTVLAGRVNIRPDGTLNYKCPRNADKSTWRKLDPEGNADLLRTGVGVNRMVSISGRIMLFTSLSYLVIQGAAFFSGAVFKAMQNRTTTLQAAGREHMFALVCAIFSFALFFWYLWYQVKTSRRETDYRDSVVEAVTQRAIRDGKISLSTAFFAELSDVASAASESTGLLSDEHTDSRFRHLLKTFFITYDHNKDGSIDVAELQYVMYDLGERLTPAEIEHLHDEMDLDKSGTIDFEEFCTAIPRFIKRRTINSTLNGEVADGFVPESEAPCSSKETKGRVSAAEEGREEGHEPEDEEDEEWEEEEEVPEELKHKDPKIQIRKVTARSFQMMAVGTILVMLFSDPMVDVLTDMGRRLGISSFYISFIFAPMASNASEILASARYASKKTHKSVTISFATLLGAAIMNNTFVVGIFMSLIFARTLAWQFSAETFSILFVEYVMVFLSQKKHQTLLDGCLALSLLPLSLLLVAFLEGVIGLD